jgi:small subunit ribosomal protein S6
MVIVDPDVDDAQISEAIGKLKKIITDDGGEVEKVDEWGRRTMAYEINNKKEGYYAIIHFKGSVELPDRLRREIRLNPQIMRGMIVRRDE